MPTDKKDRENYARIAIKAKSKGVPFTKTANDFDISIKTLRNWVNEYEKKLNEKWEEKGFNSLGEKLESFDSQETVEVIVFDGKIKDKNFLIVTIENPKMSDPEEYDAELRRRVMNKLKYGFAAKGFYLMDKIAQ